MSFTKQPRNSRLCGQSVVAMALGITLGEACRLVGHTHATRTRELLAALGKLCTDGRLVEVVRRPIPDFAILKVVPIGQLKDGHGPWHWVLRRGADVYDPELSTPVSLEGWQEVRCVRRGWRVTSTLKLREPATVLGS
jgi:hypothetical protein